MPTSSAFWKKLSADAITGMIREHALLILGSGRNGKSTFLGHTGDSWSLCHESALEGLLARQQ